MIILLQGKDQEDDYSERMLLEKQINFMAIRTFYGDRVQNVAYLLSLMGKELLPMSFGARHHRWGLRQKSNADSTSWARRDILFCNFLCFLWQTVPFMALYSHET